MPKRHVTYLQQTGQSNAPPVPPPRPGALVHRQSLRPQEYRRLYGNLALGRRAPGRLEMDGQALTTLLGSKDLQFFQLDIGHMAAGFAEVQRAGWEEMELACWGLMRSAADPLLLGYLLDQTVRALWADKPRRVWLRVLDSDPPEMQRAALAVGFGIYDRRDEDVPAGS